MVLGVMALAALVGAAGGEVSDEESRFLDECRYILTKLEVKMFRSLDTKEQKHDFIENFWKGLDPNPLTQVNEFKDTYYARIEEANRLYSRGTPGYLTDRGKVYILMGPPDEKESNPVGRTSSEHASEIWTYRSEKHRGMPRDSELVFIDDSGSGNYHLSSRVSLDAGAARAEAVKDLQPYSDTGSIDVPAMKTILGAQQNPRELPEDATMVAEGGTPAAPPASEAPPAAAELKVTSKSRYDTFKAQAVNGSPRTLVVMTVGIDTASAPAGLAGYKVYGEIRPKVDDPANPPTDLKSAFESKETEGELLYQAQAPLAPGDYRVIYGITETASNATKSFEDPLTVPSYDDGSFKLSSIVTASKLEEKKDATADPGATLKPFELSGVTVVPSVSGAFKKKDELGVYFQMYGAKPPATVDYIIYRKLNPPDKGKDWKPIGKMPTPNQQQMVQEYFLPLSTIKEGAGDYKVVVTVTDSGAQVAKGEAPFTVK